MVKPGGIVDTKLAAFCAIDEEIYGTEWRPHITLVSMTPLGSRKPNPPL